jgi:hypothetical protein
MTRTFCTVGSTDPAAPHDVRAALDMLERLLALCESRLQHEDEFIHPALERARTGSAPRSRRRLRGRRRCAAANARQASLFSVPVASASR